MSYSSGYGRGQDDAGSSSSSMKVDSSSVGKIIGRGGSKIRELEQSCRVRIKISRDADEEGMKSIEISGCDTEIEKARRMIEECLAGDYSGGGGGGGRRGGFGSSGGGSGRGRSGFGRRDDGDNWGHRDRENGDSYQRRDDYDRGSRGGGRGGGFSSGGDSETIFVESSEVGRIIGRGGSRIRDMEADSGCRIKVSRDGDSRGRSSVELQGSKSAISEAKRLIQEAGVEIVNGDDRGRGW